MRKTNNKLKKIKLSNKKCQDSLIYLTRQEEIMVTNVRTGPTRHSY